MKKINTDYKPRTWNWSRLEFSRLSRKPWGNSFKHVYLCVFFSVLAVTPRASAKQRRINYHYPLYHWSAFASTLLWGTKWSFLFGNEACGHLTKKKLSNCGKRNSEGCWKVSTWFKSLRPEHSVSPYVNLVPKFSLLPGGREMRDLGNEVALRYHLKK